MTSNFSPDKIEYRREKILAYINSQKNSPLVFGRRFFHPDLEKVELPNCDNTDQLVYNVLVMARTQSSWCMETSRSETCSGKMRSSLDIWRHICSIRDDVTIFDVMESLYRLANPMRRVSGHFCTVVRRGVFAADSYPAWRTEPLNFRSGEYGIWFSSWRKLHLG